ncbi:hypothetical protein ABIE53_002584 [Burkholderia sp. OAS925]|uniref:hypothetical protein n=1 Tax=Paraburkholderia TaxID=1822464 RepID=UPI0012900BAC|nr:hypothetical protein [Paraburkholderia graminis]MDR6473549.1 hypothetical protein [Paraburkholderia graminis]
MLGDTISGELIVRDAWELQKPEWLAYRANNVEKFASAAKSFITVFMRRTSVFPAAQQSAFDSRRAS